MNKRNLYSYIYCLWKSPCCLASQLTPTRYFLHFCFIHVWQKYPAFPSLCLKEEMIFRRKAKSELQRSMRSWSSSRLLCYFCCLHIVELQLFILFFVLRSRVCRRIFRSCIRQRVLFLYAGIKVKAFAFWSVLRRRNRRSWTVLVVRTSAVWIRSLIHSPSLCSTNVWKHVFLFSFNFDSRCKVSFLASVIQWNRCEYLFDD